MADLLATSVITTQAVSMVLIIGLLALLVIIAILIRAVVVLIEQRPGGKLRWKSLLTDMAVGTGCGIRYDMKLFVIRLDWGIGIHVPYHTERKGIYNIPSFRDGNSFHLAIGYPF